MSTHGLVTAILVMLAHVAPAQGAPLSERVAQGGPCAPSWLPTFGGQPGTELWPEALVVFDDGGGPTVYAGGFFEIAGGGTVNNVAKWDGSSWAPLGSGTGGGPVAALTVYDDGSGPALYAGGYFTTAGGVAANRIAKWDGSSWAPLGSGVGDPVYALAVFDDGSGPALYASGQFATAGGAPANRIARWSGTSWSALGSGVSSGASTLTVFDEGSGPCLFAGGGFTSAGGAAASRIARWNGSSWSAVGGGMNEPVVALIAHDDGSGLALYAGGVFTTAGGVAANRMAKWDGLAWSPLGSEMIGAPPTRVSALAVFDDGSGPRLCAAGVFVSTPAASQIELWDGSSWECMGRGLNDQVRALTMHDDGSGPALYAAGSLTAVGGLTANHVARWNGSSWTPLGSGTNGDIFALTVFDDGAGAALYAGGAFTTAGGVAALRVAKWDGSQWWDLDGGIDGPVHALTVFDDGGGPALYAGGTFTTAGGLSANRVARWNGSSWSALGTGLGGITPSVRALVVHDDGSGAALYAGGSFTAAGGVLANRIARWNGSSWSALGTGTSSAVLCMTVFDDGGGAALFAGGSFGVAGGLGVARIAKWNGSVWTGLASTGMQADVLALHVFDDGSGPALYAGGAFTAAGGVAANRIAKWNGSTWSALGAGVGLVANSSVNALTVLDEGNRQTLFVGGNFGGTLDSGDSFLALWSGCTDSLAPELECPSAVFVVDRRGSAPGEIVNFAVTATDAFDPSPSIVCVPPSGSLFPRGRTLVHCTATDATGNQSSCQFPISVEMKARRY